LCRAAANRRLMRGLGNTLLRNRPPVPVNYLYSYRIGIDELKAGAALVFIATSISSIVVLSFMQFYILLPVFLLISYGTSTWFHDSISRQFEKEKTMISYQVPLILQEIALASAGSGSIFDLVLLVAKGNHGIVSDAFARIAKRIGNGEEPERLVSKYANSQPCESLRRYLMDALAVNLEWSDLKKVLRERKGEAEYEYQRYTMQVESRVLLIVGLGTFWPIIFSVAVLVNSLSNDLLSMIIIAMVFTVLLLVLQRQLMKPVRRTEILGSQGNLDKTKGLTNHTAKQELQELMVVLSLIGESLHREKLSPEAALRTASETYSGWLSPILREAMCRVLYDGETFNDAWLSLRDRFSSDQCRQIISMLPQMLEKTAEEAGERLVEVVSYIKENQVLIEERENIITAQRFKAKLLSLFSSAALGLIGALSPLFAMISTRRLSIPAFGLSILSHDTMLPTIVLLSMTVINTLNAMKTVGVEKPIPYTFFCTSVFLVVFATSIHLISGLA
jgi:hypothetical protein